jgi:hypothetical protein
VKFRRRDKKLQIANEKYTILQPKTTPLFLKKISETPPAEAGGVSLKN